MSSKKIAKVKKPGNFTKKARMPKAKKRVKRKAAHDARDVSRRAA